MYGLSVDVPAPHRSRRSLEALASDTVCALLQVEESNIAYAKYRVLREENMRLKQELEDCHHRSDTGSDGSPGTEEDRSEVTVQYGPFTRQSVISDTFSNDAPHIPTLPPGEVCCLPSTVACARKLLPCAAAAACARSSPELSKRPSCPRRRLLDLARC